MQVAGNSNHSDKILSIQSQLGGLSFYCSMVGRYTYRNIKEDRSDSISIIESEYRLEDYDYMTLTVDTTRYIMIPEPLFNEAMCETYLQTKGYTISSDEVIRYSIYNGVAFITIVPQNYIVSEDIKVLYLPTIAKLYIFTEGYEDDILTYAIVDNNLHIAIKYGGEILLVESYTLLSKSDAIFYIDEVIAQLVKGKKIDIISLFEDGDNQLPAIYRDNMKIKSVLKESFFEL